MFLYISMYVGAHSVRPPFIAMVWKQGGPGPLVRGQILPFFAYFLSEKESKAHSMRRSWSTSTRMDRP